MTIWLHNSMDLRSSFSRWEANAVHKPYFWKASCSFKPLYPFSVSFVSRNSAHYFSMMLLMLLSCMSYLSQGSYLFLWRLCSSPIVSTLHWQWNYYLQSSVYKHILWTSISSPIPNDEDNQAVWVRKFDKARRFQVTLLGAFQVMGHGTVCRNSWNRQSQVHNS